MSGSAGAYLTPESKSALRRVIQNLRKRLLHELRDHAEQRYLLKVPYEKAKTSLTQELRERRRRLESALMQRADEEGGDAAAHDRAFATVLKEVGSTYLNRLVMLRHLEATGLSKPAVVTHGWKSPGYKQFREAAPALIGDETQGYAILLQLLFDELAADLPGLFGNVGLTTLLPLSPSTLRAVIEELDEVPADAWKDDLTLGWVYQFWNDPDREALDEKVLNGGKLEHHELASKTQMFTERYMVQWLLQNSLGSTWLAMCRKNGWTADVERDGTIASLDARRAEWRTKREAGEVPPDALMPIAEHEEAWKYFVPQPMPDAVIDSAPVSLRELRLIDPACGSGHFLVVAFDLLVELYREEARHRGVEVSDREIAESVLEHNLHGVDIDPRAVQIAAAALFVKARSLSRDAHPKRVNLVAPALRISALAADDPALVRLEESVEDETGIPAELTRQLVQVLAGVDHLGSLLKVGDEVDRAIRRHRGELARKRPQLKLFEENVGDELEKLSATDAKRAILELLEGFFAKHEGEEDLGLRLQGQQLKAGLRFTTIVREGTYDVVVANPPYQGTAKMKDAKYIAKHYPRGKSDLFAAFLERGLELCKPGGVSAMVTMRSWMFLTSYTRLREHLLEAYDLRVLGDVDRGAFDEVPNEVLATAMSVFRNGQPASEHSVALQPTPLSDKSYDRNRTARKRAAVLAQVGRFEFHTSSTRAVSESPLLYWWNDERRLEYRNLPKIGDVTTSKEGVGTKNDPRYIRKWWEVQAESLFVRKHPQDHPPVLGHTYWVPFVKGAAGRAWWEPLSDIVNWRHLGLEIATYSKSRYGRGATHYFKQGVACVTTGNRFSARLHRFASIFGHAGTSFFGEQPEKLSCILNSKECSSIIMELNSGISFQLTDIRRASLSPSAWWREIYATLERSFSEHEAGRETSVEFIKPQRSSWKSAQSWAQLAVDSEPNSPLPAFTPQFKEPHADDHLSYAFGQAIGRFPSPAGTPLGERASGIIFISIRNPNSAHSHKPMQDAWEAHGEDSTGSSLDSWLRNSFFEYHRKLYEGRPIYLPLSSTRRSFIAYVSIHHWSDSTLTKLLADHLLRERRAIEGALVDLQMARSSTDKTTREFAGPAYNRHRKWLEELEDFIAKVQAIADHGPPPPDTKTPPREQDAPFQMNLDDGVMVNSAALWPLLEPMWKEPKKWWKELATSKGRKDYDWSHMAARYFPSRVDEKCRKDPSLAVAHGCFWRYHPEKAFQWELRLQGEIGSDFTIDEEDSDALRARFLEESPERVKELRGAEQARRDRKERKEAQEELELDATDDEEEVEEDLEDTGT